MNTPEKQEAFDNIKEWFASRDVTLSIWDEWYIKAILNILADKSELKGLERRAK
jgi:hypothetical protein